MAKKRIKDKIHKKENFEGVMRTKLGEGGELLFLQLLDKAFTSQSVMI